MEKQRKHATGEGAQETGERAQAAPEESQPADGAEPARDAAEPSMIHELATRQTEVAQTLSDLSNQSAFMRQQVGQLYAVTTQLYQAVSAQCQQLSQSDSALLRELQKFQTGGPQRAMAGLYCKLFRDLIQHINEMDEIVGAVAAGGATAESASGAWLEALRVARDRFETLLKDWGCTPVVVRVSEQEFDPEQHEAVEAAPGEVLAAGPPHTVVKVRRRGWVMNGQVLQYPQVVVS